MLIDVTYRGVYVGNESDLDDLIDRCLAAEASLLALQQQMAKVRAHTSWNRPIDGSGLETLLAGLLESIERIADAALA